MSRSLQLLSLLSLLVVAGCATTPPNVAGAGTQLQTRQIQTREYDTLDKAMTMRSVIATLQDLGFTIDQADAEHRRGEPDRVGDTLGKRLRDRPPHGPVLELRASQIPREVRRDPEAQECILRATPTVAAMAARAGASGCSAPWQSHPVEQLATLGGIGAQPR